MIISFLLQGIAFLLPSPNARNGGLRREVASPSLLVEDFTAFYPSLPVADAQASPFGFSPR
jgi:hypothetical protein